MIPGTLIEGASLEDNITAGGDVVPPDSAGAVSQTHLVSAVNSIITFQSKDGLNAPVHITLNNFFGNIATDINGNQVTDPETFVTQQVFDPNNAAVAPQDLLFDPRVVFDHYTNRFLSSLLTLTRRISQRSIWVFPDDANPFGRWDFMSINAFITIDALQTWADYVHMGITEDTIMLTSNQFFVPGGFADARI